MPALEIVILILLFASCAALIFTNFNSALGVLLLLSVFLHKEFFSVFRWDLLPVRILMLALLLEFIRRFHTKEKIREALSKPVPLLLAAMWVTNAVSLIFTLNLTESIFLLGFFTTIVALGFLLFDQLAGKSEKILNLIKTYIYIVFGLSIFGLVQLSVYQKTGFIFGALWNIPGRLARVGATFWDVNHYGAVLAALLPVLGVLILIEKTWKKRLVYAGMFLPMVAGLGLTNSRSAWILAFVAFIVFLLIQLLRRWGTKGILTLALVMAVIAGAGLWEYSNKQSPFRAYIKDYFHYRIDSFDSHMYLLRGSFQVLEAFPYFGGGYGSFFEQFSQTDIAPLYFGRDPISLTSGLRAPGHSIWGETAAETGWVGLAVLVAFVAVTISTMLYVALTHKDQKESLLVSAMTAALVGWFVAGIFYSYKAEFFWIILFLYYLYAESVAPTKLTLTKVFEYFSRSGKTAVAVVLSLGLVLILFGLGKNHMIPWDEAIYGKIAKNIVNTGDWLTLHWNLAEPWYEKPPLFMWLSAASMWVFGITEFAARFPSALFGILGALLTFVFGRKLFNKTTGFFAALALLTTTSYVYYSRNAMLDVTTTFFTTAALYFYWKALENRAQLKNWILAGVFVGLGALTKNVVGLLPFAIIGFYELYLLISKQAKFNFKAYLAMFATAMAIFLPWHLVMYQLYGQAFIDKYVFYHILDRGFTEIENKGEPFWWYIIVMKVSMRIWFVVLLGALPFALFNATAKKDKKFVFLLTVFAVLFLFFSSAKSKLVWYIMPLYPFVAILCGAFLERFLNFVMGKFKFLNTRMFKALSIYSVTAFALFYFFLVKGLVYPGDLTGPEAELLQLKEQVYGRELPAYVDKIAPPVTMFYLDGPYQEVEYSGLELALETADYDQPTVYITKESRQERLSGKYPRSVLVKRVGDHILGFLDSDYAFDQVELDAVNAALEDAPTPELTLRKAEIEARIEAGFSSLTR